ncbi:MBL fold metallo-hydrolase RNA specificity domain-containing protein [Pseudobacteroides cellulosolvens]|uniref:MBL fold metallo-hydrolase RNA specificity domain-containing protein n=1 Tax=Pseudobacteroides cellulosolvens TaxID=35825 RepID=UPI0009DF9885|nr:MBL fold metallo-hydrolase RNA specificity domain-containing protein [Pseudobacteroides cellulosolvens]
MCQKELKLMHQLVKPKYFMPVHGEYRNLKQHTKLAVVRYDTEEYFDYGNRTVA